MFKELDQIGSQAAFSQQDIEHFVEVDDRGSEITIFAFTGLASLFVGLPAFEFRSLLKGSGYDFNVVCFRDIRRLSYHLTPDGSPGGLAFYENHARQLMQQMGANHHVALGASGGGSAAIYFANRCGMQQAIAFSPSYPATEYCTIRHQLEAYFDLRRLFRSLESYVELLVITLAAKRAYFGIRKQLGPSEYWRVLEDLAENANRPDTKIVYGAHCKPDARIAARFSTVPGVSLHPLETDLHGVAPFLKKRGELGPLIVESVRRAAASRGVELTKKSATALPPPRVAALSSDR